MNKFTVEKRDLGVKTKLLRKNGNVPGTIYGATMESTPIKSTLKEFLKVTSLSGEIYTVNVDGQSYMAKLGEIQREPDTGKYVHFSLVELPKGVASDLDVPFVIEGQAIGEKSGGTVDVMYDTITLTGMPKDLPKEIKVDVSGMDVNDKITIADLKVPKGITFNLPEDEALIICRPAQVVSEEPAAEAAPAEGAVDPTAVEATEQKND